MIDSLEVILIIMFSIEFFVAANHLILYAQLGKQQRVSLTFALTCIAIGIYDIFCIGLYSAVSVNDGANWQRAQFISNQIATIMFMWFIMDYISYKKVRSKYIWSIFFTVTALFGVFDQAGLILDISQPAIKSLQINSKLTMTYFEVASGPLKTGAFIGILLLFVFLLGITTRYYRLGHKKEARPLLIAFIIIFLFAGNDIAISSRLYSSIYLTEYAFMGMVILITVTLSKMVVGSIRKYRQLSEMKSNLVTFASHELKTPLVPLNGWIELMQKYVENGQDLNQLIGKEEIASMNHATTRLLRLIKNFLDVARLERNVIEIERTPSSIATILDTVTKELDTLAIRNHITIQNTATDTIIPVDTLRIEEVLINILSNAIKYSPEGTNVLISSTNETTFYRLQIHDQGYGFTTEELQDVFQPFSSAYLRKKGTNLAGTGVGLYLAKGIVEQHGGTIRISSPGPNQGTTVEILLPLHPLGSN